MLRNDVQVAENFAEFLIKGYPAGSLIELILFNAWHDYQTNHFAPSPPGRPITMAGLFDRWDHVGCAAARTKDVSIYINPNPIRRRPGLTETNKIERIKQGDCVRKSDLEFLRWLIIDIDPVVPGGRNGLNATEQEHQACLDLMKLILGGEPMIDEASLYGSSGNGAFLMIRLPDLPITNDETRAKVAAFVATMICKYPAGAAEIDPGSKDVSKKIGLPGTYKCRGPHSEERPRRRVSIHRTDQAVKPLNLEAWLSQNAVEAPTIVQTHPDRLDAPRRRTRGPGQGMNDLEEARLWLQDRPPAISGKGGRRHTFSTVCTVLKGWALTQQETLALIEVWNQTCEPPWTTKELVEIIRDAEKADDYQPKGYMRGCRRQSPKPKAPRPVITFDLSDQELD